MANPSLDLQTHTKIHELRRQGASMRQIARSVGISYGVVHKYVHIAPPVPPRSNKKRGDFSWREWAVKAQDFQKLKRKGSFSQDRAFVELGDGTKPVALATFSDQHMGSWGCDYAQLLEMTDELLQTPNLFIALLGDYGQYSIKLRSVLEVADNLVPPEQQTQFIEDWFDEIWHKVAFATWDNHAVERQEQLAGESSVKKLMSKKVVWFNGIGHVDVKVGKQIYRGAVSHKFQGRSMLNPVHAPMRYMRFKGTDRDFAMQGDFHEPGMAKYCDGDKTRVAIVSGSLQANSGFAKRYFSLTTHPVYPIVVFHPDRHEMTPYWSIKEWLACSGA
jgi:hypothetical protein